MDHSSLEARHVAIKDLVKQSFGREVSSIDSLGRDSNNYAHLVSLVEAPVGSADHAVSPPKPGTKLLPRSTQNIVVRISNPDAMLNDVVRVESEVASITLMRDALSAFPTRIVPDVYDWNTAAKGHGWIVQEYMSGELLGDRFSKFSESQKEHVLDEVAQILHLIQSYTPNVTGFGGLNFDHEGKVVTGASSLWFGGPFATYTDMYMFIFRKQMEIAASSSLVNGWKDSDVASRLETFDQSGGFVKLLSSYHEFRPALVHGDISLENVLFDPETLKVTALLDYDFTQIASPADEYFYSFLQFHGLVIGPLEDAEMENLRLALLNGFKDKSLYDAAAEGHIDWKTAEMWQSAMKKATVKSPADIEGIGELGAICWFLLDVSPPWFLLPKWLAKRTEEEKQTQKMKIQGNLDKYLARWGY
ncbi:hypothetical protein N7493_012103 [Penicillium malachiteum]|uniref:Aminoglycoside phosphotransferase domain-containing protein n=1 Tax=Penicillium malachiteum TaxID=1324776 RepID=A0AAD6H9V9_9EURO|nr:hypothetical protein N7493_012103 [Penicillium malachiteum]